MSSNKKGSKTMAPDGVTMVKYGGTVTDIANLLKQVQKADQERSMAEKKIESLEKQIDILKSKASSNEATSTNLSGDLLDVQKKLSTSERALIGSSTCSKKLIDIIGTAQKNLDEVMLKFNEVLEEALLPPTQTDNWEKFSHFLWCRVNISFLFAFSYLICFDLSMALHISLHIGTFPNLRLL
nr:uncharacterized protein LOC129278097 [Lytechinus pictus]